MCPSCGQPPTQSNQKITCNYCNLDYKFQNSGALDLRPQREKAIRYDFTIGAPSSIPNHLDFRLLPMNATPEVDYSGFRVPRHVSKEMLSHFPKAKTDKSLMLDLGCGRAIHREICQHAGFEYVGLDYGSPEAPILGDAHALPFKDESFEFILSIAVLEHIRFPFVMMKEAYRESDPVFLDTE